MSRPILITGARAPVAIDLARSFQAAGYDTKLADSINCYAAKMAKLGSVISLPKPRFEFNAFATTLKSYCDNDPDVLIIPTCEEVFFIRSAAEKNNFMTNVFAPPLEILRQLHSKIIFPTLLQSLGIEAPLTESIEAGLTSDIMVNKVLKPEYSRFGNTTFVQPNAGQCARIKPSANIRWAMQSFVEGEEFCLWSAARNGELVASVVYRPKWRHGQTAAYAFEAVDAPEAIEIAKHLAASLKITGQISLDMIRREDGKYIPIECNPRAVSGVHLFGGDAKLANALTGEGPPIHITSGMRHILPAMLLMGLPNAFRTNRLKEWSSDFIAAKDVLSQGHNYWPILGAFMDAVRFATIGLTKWHSPNRQTTDDIEWNGEPL